MKIESLNSAPVLMNETPQEKITLPVSYPDASFQVHFRAPEGRPELPSPGSFSFQEEFPSCFLDQLKTFIDIVESMDVKMLQMVKHQLGKVGDVEAKALERQGVALKDLQEKLKEAGFFDFLTKWGSVAAGVVALVAGIVTQNLSLGITGGMTTIGGLTMETKRIPASFYSKNQKPNLVFGATLGMGTVAVIAMTIKLSSGAVPVGSLLLERALPAFLALVVGSSRVMSTMSDIDMDEMKKEHAEIDGLLVEVAHITEALQQGVLSSRKQLASVHYRCKEIQREYVEVRKHLTASFLAGG